MGKKGGNKKIKALSVSKAVHINRKAHTWSVKVRPGPHSAKLSIALAIVVRDYLGLAETLNEAKKILSKGEVKINGVVRRDHKFGVGLFDVVEIISQKICYRVVFDKKGRLDLRALSKVSSEKICRVEKKSVTSKGIQVTTNDGRNFFGVEAKVGDSLKIKVPDGKVEKVLPLKNGAHIYIIQGVHCAERGVINEIVEGTQKREKLVKFSKNGKDFETVSRNAFVIDEKENDLEDKK